MKESTLAGDGNEMKRDHDALGKCRVAGDGLGPRDSCWPAICAGLGSTGQSCDGRRRLEPRPGDGESRMRASAYDEAAGADWIDGWMIRGNGTFASVLLILMLVVMMRTGSLCHIVKSPWPCKGRTGKSGSLRISKHCQCATEQPIAPSSYLLDCQSQLECSCLGLQKSHDGHH